MDIYNTRDKTLADPKKKHVSSFLLSSLILHGLIMLAALYSSLVPTQTISNTEPPIFKSYIYKAAPSAPSIKNKANTIVPPIPKELTDSAVQGATKQPVLGLDDIAESNKPTPRVVSPSAYALEAVKQTAKIQRAPEHHNVISASSVVLTSSSSDTSILVDRPVEQMVLQHLQTYQREYAQQQAREYRQQKVSPIINTQTAVNTLLPAEIAPDVSVDCGNRVKKILTNISGVTGGRLKCRRNDEFQRYIDKRFGKTSDSEDSKK